jgi:kinesin family protein 2/24
MKGIQNLAIDSLFKELNKINNKKYVIYISFFEIYGGRLYDLLNNKNKLQVLDDKNGKVQIFGLEEILVETSEDLQFIIEKANSIRTTHNTVTNSTSSRSHAICNIIIKEEGSNEEYGKLSLVDLAGSERAQETQSNNRQRRAEGAEINKSLLALKECIRALDARRVSGNNDIHVPFRASKLTHVLRDSFVSKSDKSRIIMISCVNPSYCSSNHSINTLRYSDRLKEQTSVMSKLNCNNNINSNCNNYCNGGNVEKKMRVNSSNKSYRNNNSNQNGKNNKNGFGNKKNVDNNSDNGSDEINMNVINENDDILNDINIDKSKKENNKINKKRLESPKNNKKSPSKNNLKNNKKESKKDILEEEVDDLIYLKQTISKGGKYISDDFIKYNQLTGKIVEAEDEIVNTHMNVIKNDAKMLTDEGELITKIKGLGLNKEYFSMDEYIIQLEQMIDKKISLYSDLKGKLNIYKKHIKEEDEMRKMHPQLFVDAAEI